MTRVLVVDDSDAVRRSLCDLLTGALEGVAIGEAASASAALARVDAEPWDLVLLDLSLPDRSGLDTLRAILARRPALRVLVMSFHGQAEYAAAVRAAGGAGYITKGSPAEAMAEAVRGILFSNAPQ